jgi:hypothetical protein
MIDSASVSDPKLVSSRRLWRALAASGVPVMVVLWALWRDVYMLDTGGLVHLGGSKANSEWAALSLGTAVLGAMFWAPLRAARVLSYAAYSLVLSLAFSIAGVLGVLHGSGGPGGDLDAPAWALWLLGLLAALCVAALLATAALFVADVREGDAERPS